MTTPAAPAAPATKRVHLSSSAPSKQAEDFLRDRGDDYAAMRGLAPDRDMTPVERLKAVRLSRVNYKRSGIYGQLVDTLTNFVVGDGVVVKCDEDAAKEYLDSVFDFAPNAFHRTLRQRFGTLCVDGEYLLSVTIPTRGGPTLGGVTTLSSMPLLGRMNSDDIVDVHVSAVNQDRVVAVTVDLGAGRKETYPIARPGVVPKDNGDGTATAVLLWRVNVLGRRGLPFFSRTLDKAHRLDGVVDELARKAAYTSRFWLHATYEDQSTPAKNKAVEKKLLAWLQSIKPGEALASTKGIEVKSVAPELGMTDAKALYDLIVDYILGSHGVPRMWFSSGGDTNRATSVEQGTPIFRSVDAAQAEFVGAIRDLVEFILWIGVQSGALPGLTEDDLGFEVAPSDVATRDSLRDVKEANDLTLALDSAVASGILSPLERQAIGRRVFASKGWGDEMEEEPPPLPETPPVDPNALPGHRTQGDGTGDPALPGDGMGQGDAPAAIHDGARAAPGTPATDVQGTAMNGAQVAALADLVEKVASGELPKNAVRPLVLGAFPSFPENLIDEMLDAADKFEPPAPDTPPPPPPGTPPPAAPPAPPAPPKEPKP